MTRESEIVANIFFHFWENSPAVSLENTGGEAKLDHCIKAYPCDAQSLFSEYLFRAVQGFGERMAERGFCAQQPSASLFVFVVLGRRVSRFIVCHQSFFAKWNFTWKERNIFLIKSKEIKATKCCKETRWLLKHSECSFEAGTCQGTGYRNRMLFPSILIEHFAMGLNVKNKTTKKVKAGTPEVSFNTLEKCVSFEVVKSSFLVLPFSSIKRGYKTKIRVGWQPLGSCWKYFGLRTLHLHPQLLHGQVPFSRAESSQGLFSILRT